MKMAKVFTTGHSQAVRLPKECRFTHGEKEVYVRKFDDMVILIPKKHAWKSFLESLGQFSGEFARNQPMGSDKREEMV